MTSGPPFLFQVDVELGILKEYLDLLDEQLLPLMRLHRATIWKRLPDGLDASNNLDDYYAEQGALWSLEHLDEGISIRFLTAASVLAMWADYEAIITKIAEMVRQDRAPAAEAFEPRSAFVERAKEYFKDTLKMPLHQPDMDWPRLHRLNDIRNAFAHANGRLESIPPKKRTFLTRFAQESPASLIVRPSLLGDGEYLIATREYARSELAFIGGLLSELIGRM